MKNIYIYIYILILDFKDKIMKDYFLLKLTYMKINHHCI